MAQVLLAAVVVLSLLLVVGGAVVWRLRAEVRQLAEQVASMRSSEPRHARLPVAAESRPARLPDEAGAQHRRAPVVITGLDGSPDPTTAQVASVVLAKPLIKTAALAFGVRRALDDEHRIRMTMAFRQELRRQRKLRRRAMRAAPESGP